MASVNTTSVKAEIARVEEDLERLSAAGKVSEESRVLINTLLMILNLLVSVFMEKSTRKNSKNSSLPSSQTSTDRSTPGHSSRNKKAASQHKESFSHARTVETEAVISVTACDHCGESLKSVATKGHERRTLIDLVFEKRVEHTDAEIKQCPGCGETTKGCFASHLSGPLQYGLGVKAYIINLLVTQMVSLNRVQSQLTTLVGQTISQAVMLKYLLQLHESLAAWEADAIEHLLKAPVMHADETGLKVEKTNHWIHVCSAGEITLKRLHTKRGAQALDDINIIPRYGGVIVHDCWATYFKYERSEDALCGSHLLRELEFSIDSNDYRWAANMKRLLQQTCATVSERKRKRLTPVEYAKLQKRYRNILTRGQAELPPRPVRPSGQRGRLAQSDSQNLWDRLKEHESAVLLFAKRANVPFTNNRAERDIRMSKVKQKVSGCFRQRQYAEAYCRITSYLQTMANQGYNPLIAIQMALTGRIHSATV